MQVSIPDPLQLNIGLCVYPVAPSPPPGAVGGGSTIARRVGSDTSAAADSDGITANVDVVVKNDGAKIRKGESGTNEMLFKLHNVSFEDLLSSFIMKNRI